MSEQNEHKDDRQPTGEKAEQFFREIEIEFLVHELKDPIAIIETGLRTLLEAHIAKFKKSPGAASQPAGDWTLRSRMLYWRALSTVKINPAGFGRCP
jgi:hypothetical protein